MKNFTFTLAALMIAAFTFAGTPGGPDNYTVDTKKSALNWVGEKVTGSHMGTIDIRSGNITVNRGMIETAEITIDMTSILVTDEGMSEDMKGKLKGHLDSPDFFNVAEHASATFSLTAFMPDRAKGGNNYTVTGKLTIKGISQEITFPATVDMKDGMIMANADLTFDRSKFDIRYGSGSFFDGLGDKMIYDDVKINFSLVANK